MATEVKMPQLGESVVEGTVTRWLKNPGDSVLEYEPLVEINTDKVDTEIPAPASGVMLAVYIAEGETVDAGTLLAMIGAEGEEVPAEPARAEAAVEASARASPAPPASAVKPPSGDGLGFISPVVARMAAEHNLDLAGVSGTGRSGRITKKDVLAYLEAQTDVGSDAAPWEKPASGELFRPSEEVFGDAAAEAPASTVTAGSVVPFDPVRKAIAEHMVRSRRTSPHVTTVMEADLSRVAAHRQANKEAFGRDGVKLNYGAYFARAAVESLTEYAIVNSSWSEDGIVLHPQINLGLAVSLGEGGLIVPVIPDAASKSLRGMAAAIDDLATRARSKKLAPDEVQGGTFTITNHGVGGSLFATPIINQPQCAILGVGAVQKRPVVIETRFADGEIGDALAIRLMVYLTLTFDHRILDGASADGYLASVVQKLERWG